MKTKKKQIRTPLKKRPMPRHKAKQSIIRARPLHHRVFLHPFTVFVLLCTGVFIANWTFRAAADSITVTAKVSAAPLGSGATINGPLDGAILTSTPIKVFGTCPSDSYIVLHRNATMSGMALCTVGNTYEIQTSLFPDANVLNVQAYNLTDDPGPSTPDITVTYNPPAGDAPSPTSGGGQSSTPSSNARPQAISDPPSLPLITSNFSYNTFAVNTNFEWPIDTAGGSGPYKLVAIWGDGSTTEQTLSRATSLWVKHRYSKSGYYKIILKLTDANGKESQLQLFAVIRVPISKASANGSGFLSNTGDVSVMSPLRALINQHWLQLAWGSYATVAIMSFCFWLGERQQLVNLMSRNTSRRTLKHR